MPPAADAIVHVQAVYGSKLAIVPLPALGQQSVAAQPSGISPVHALRELNRSVIDDRTVQAFGRADQTPR